MGDTERCAYQIVDDPEDILLGRLGVALVACDCDHILSLLLGELNVDLVGVTNLADDSSTATDDLGVVGRIHTNLQLEVAQLLDT